MRIVIDLQGLQSRGTRQRGIGQYTQNLVKTLIEQKDEHEIILVLNGAFMDSITHIYEVFVPLVSASHIRIWEPVLSKNNEGKAWAKSVSGTIYESFLLHLEPDLILLTNHFEGFEDETVSVIKALDHDVPVAVVLYDLIPFLFPEQYLADEHRSVYYYHKLEQLKKADLLLSISESTRLDAIRMLGLEPDKVVTISSDVDQAFKPVHLEKKAKQDKLRSLGISSHYVLYTGGADYRKNTERLIQAFARLPSTLLNDYQLVIVCAQNSATTRHLSHVAKEAGLSTEQVVFTGYIPFADLCALYSSCDLFVFPSVYEGFGLPVLEAMRCGAPVIGSNNSSISEIIACDQALFDPLDTLAIAQKIEQGLTDTAFKELLLNNTRKRSIAFSWHGTAEKTWQSLSACINLTQKTRETKVLSESSPKKRLAFVSPLPPERSGVADYSFELLQELSPYYEIEVVLDTAAQPIDWVRDHFPCLSADELRQRRSSFDRVVYHVGNSPYHRYILDLLLDVPGVVVLHDLFLADLMSLINTEHGEYAQIMWRELVYKNHGYRGLHQLLTLGDQLDRSSLPCSYTALENANGVIVHSNFARELLSKKYGPSFNQETTCQVIPLLRNTERRMTREQARQHLGITENEFLVCSFGVIGENKLLHEVVNAWIQARCAKEGEARLVLVGSTQADEYSSTLKQMIVEGQASVSMSITEWVSEDDYHAYLAAADMAIQLRGGSLGESSASILDCMTYGLPLIINNSTSMYVPPCDAVLELSTGVAIDVLANAIDQIYHDHEYRLSLASKARAYVLAHHEVALVAQSYHRVLESFYSHHCVTPIGLIDQIVNLGPCPGNNELNSLSIALDHSFSKLIRQKQFFVDVTELAEKDSKTGIQRVVRSILSEWLMNPPEGFRVEPVYFTEDRGYCYARQFTSQFLGLDDGSLLESPIEYGSGDILVGLDLVFLVSQGQYTINLMRGAGVSVFYVVYDLLPVLKKHYFGEALFYKFSDWLRFISSMDGVFCISDTVAQEFTQWCQSEHQRLPVAQVKHFHLGADIAGSQPSLGLPANHEQVLNQFKQVPTFLMVSTIEPRKGHEQVLNAFDVLWKKGVRLNLVFVGKEGWSTHTLQQRMKTHPQLNKQFFWLKGVSDEYLTSIYQSSTCLIAASHGEGFGLPLIEASMHGLPILARRLPVFEEVAQTYAAYFDSDKPVDLAKSIEDWIVLFKAGQAPQSKNMPYLTWKQSAQQLLDLCLKYQQ